MDRAQHSPITPAGLDNPPPVPGDLPSYVTNGNHDVLVQGNEDANAPSRTSRPAASRCSAPRCSSRRPSPGPIPPGPQPPPRALASACSSRPTRCAATSTSPRSRRSWRQRRGQRARLRLRRPGRERRPRDGAASYYAWDPPETPGFRFITIDTNSEGGQTAEGVASGSSNGNIDDPQFQWLENELEAAQDADKLIVIFGHHPVRSLTAEIPTRRRRPARANDTHGDTPEHDVNPGCDLDPRTSEPIHLGTDASPGRPAESFVELLDHYPNVIAYVAGPHPRAPARSLPAGQRPTRDASGGRSRPRRSPTGHPEPPDRGDGQPRRHALDLRDAGRPRLATRPARPRAPPPASTPNAARLDRPHPHLQRPGGDRIGRATSSQNAEMLLFDPARGRPLGDQDRQPGPGDRRGAAHLHDQRDQQRPDDVRRRGSTLTDDLPTTATLRLAQPHAWEPARASPVAGDARLRPRRPRRRRRPPP